MYSAFSIKKVFLIWSPESVMNSYNAFCGIYTIWLRSFISSEWKYYSKGKYCIKGMPKH